MFFVFAANADAVFLNNKGMFIDLAQLTAQMGTFIFGKNCHDHVGLTLGITAAVASLLDRKSVV